MPGLAYGASVALATLRTSRCMRIVPAKPRRAKNASTCRRSCSVRACKVAAAQELDHRRTLTAGPHSEPGRQQAESRRRTEEAGGCCCRPHPPTSATSMMTLPGAGRAR